MQEDAVVPREVTMQRMMPGFSLVANYRRDQDYTVADRIEERARDSADRPFIIFEGRTVQGIAAATISQGKLVYAKGELRTTRGAGRYLKREPFGANFEAVKRRADALAPTGVAR